MNILLVYPEFLVTFWSWKHLLRLISKKAAFPPLGLLTVAAMLPEQWNKKLVDLNILQLTDEDIKWADYVFVSAMITQSDSAERIIARCKELGVAVVLGGPILEMGCDKFPSVSHFMVGEVENTFSKFLEDLRLGKARQIYLPGDFPDLVLSPIPLWDIINHGDYACMLVQYGRGCPHRCTFCNEAALNGRVPRAKSPTQFLRELDAIYQIGFKGPIMLADANFIGDKRKVREMLPHLIKWQQNREYPFSFTVEVDITLADDHDLMDQMVLAGFKSVFLGLETPNKASLIECRKTHNASRDMLACVKRIHNHGLLAMSGFILGFDNDGPDIFDKHIKFYWQAGIVFPMAGVLQAPLRTELFDRLNKEGRLLAATTGNNTDSRPNFIPKMPLDALVTGYKRVMGVVYSPKKYYERICVFLREYNSAKKVGEKLTAKDLKVFVVSIWVIGFFGGLKTSYYYWKTLLLAFFKYRRAFPEAVTLQVYGWHFHRIAKSIQKS
ncbi:MAG: DUF4070 domain-containing protein [Candidatus Staskawiczbacteria bacterium]|nr:DUF4070 domain-containing protein [Candidatus Staskawiczbacteria bacterium]